MSYEPKLKALRTSAAGLFSSYGIPAALFLVLALAALYLLAGRGGGSVPDFPRSAGEFLQTSKAERRLAELSARLAAVPDDMHALAESGRLKYQLGPSRYPEAIADLEKARDLGLADVRTFYYLGNMYQSAGLYDFAEQEYRRFLNNDPGDTEVRMLLAKLCYSSGDYPCAVREFEMLEARTSGDPVLLENLALSRWKNGQDHSSVLSDLRALGGTGAFLADYAEGRIAYESGNYPKALDALGRAINASDSAGAFADKAELYWMAGDAAWRGKDAAAAALYLGELLKVSPGHEEGRALLAKAVKASARKPARK